MSRTRNTDNERADLLARVRDVIVTDQLVDALIDLAIEIAEAKLRDRLQVLLGGLDADETPTSARGRKVTGGRLPRVRTESSGPDARVGKGALVPRAADRPADSKRARGRRTAEGPKKPACGRCGKSGHNARTCGRESSSDDAEEEREAVPAIATAPALSVLPPPFPAERCRRSRRALRSPRSRSASSRSRSASSRWGHGLAC